MNTRSTIAAMAVLLSVFSVTAAAGTPGWYFGGEAGASFLQDGDNSLETDPSFTPGTPGGGGGGLIVIPGLLTLFPTGGSPGTPGSFTPGTQRNFDTEYDTGFLGGLTLGYLFPSGWRLELEARYAKNDLDKIAIGNTGSSDANGDLTSIALMGNAWFDFNQDGSWHPYIGAGIGGARLELDTNSLQTGNGGYKDDDIVFAYQGGAGINFDLTERTVIDLGYRYFATEDPGYSDSGFNVNGEYEQQVALLSLRYTFAPSELPDADGDGVPDSEDQCPDTPPGVRVDSKGCPLDSDGDGVLNDQDQCPNTPEGIQVNAKGCPLDSDGDGVPDYKDECPNTPAGTKVNDKGCPLVVDSDGDGVPDDQDQCPNTPAGVPVLTNGCAVGQSDVLEGVKFEFDKAVLTPNAEQILDNVTQTVKDSPGFKIEIAGYTDSVGSDSYNQGLSQRRADSVKRYLVDNGVNAGRLTTIGHGENNPVATNDTEAGRAKNRRVELTATDGDGQ